MKLCYTETIQKVYLLSTIFQILRFEQCRCGNGVKVCLCANFRGLELFSRFRCCVLRSSILGLYGVRFQMRAGAGGGDWQIFEKTIDVAKWLLSTSIHLQHVASIQPRTRVPQNI